MSYLTDSSIDFIFKGISKCDREENAIVFMYSCKASENGKKS